MSRNGKSSIVMRCSALVRIASDGVLFFSIAWCAALHRAGGSGVDKFMAVAGEGVDMPSSGWEGQWSCTLAFTAFFDICSVRQVALSRIACGGATLFALVWCSSWACVLSWPFSISSTWGKVQCWSVCPAVAGRILLFCYFRPE